MHLDRQLDRVHLGPGDPANTVLDAELAHGGELVSHGLVLLLTHQTSPRFIGYVSQRRFGPLQCFCLARFLLGHLLVSKLQVFAKNVGPHERLDELADTPPAHHAVQPSVHALVHRDGQFLLYGGLRLHVLLNVL